ncbi:hypothetical protein A2852_00250 [Candidatus Adlerbacteria bacterium RIFCSPHIGHO2_01_FULL_54_23]|uniref:phosphomannomutase n=3 Tax=Candidatus Adleribacteriota TaxID=1752736 RepID=A0A1F4XZL1_9BACT|nr:MAG: HAD-superhydrolase, subIIB family protein [Candidatus Adlerbacteria bacterium GW2011_GWA1_54_10]KKW38088.1 MAG: HAD-superhydrolase, subIIB family protein [Candidatus Adlerbacteria bacterium GW2011_GWB1_54_7]OGC78781.1 MAG: hypothetical protein A2852_00250 [Candidatus Adlerbacteria bacterium RIFCSPHIGHO2_01_FULL_54_23]OGC87109.1 MAG: hypothetical protein A3B33_00615 [Candidatus Adlerbacteria bacterium RIFCSPLOWO2_01_FULL_54_16]
MVKPKLIAFDLDGTLAESKWRMSAEMGLLIADLLKKMPVAVMSGAGFQQFEKQFLPALPEDAPLERLYIFPTNAAQCYVYREGWKPQYDHCFSEQEKQKIFAVLKEALEENGMELRGGLWGERIEDRGAQITFSGLGQGAPIDEKQKWDPKKQTRVRIRNSLVKKLPDFSVGIGGLTSIDITRKGLTKAYGIKRLAELTGIEVTDMLYVGDALEEGGNDAVVLESGVKTHAVFGPRESEALIKDILRASSRP